MHGEHNGHEDYFYIKIIRAKYNFRLHHLRVIPYEDELLVVVAQGMHNVHTISSGISNVRSNNFECYYCYCSFC